MRKGERERSEKGRSKSDNKQARKRNEQNNQMIHTGFPLLFLSFATLSLRLILLFSLSHSLSLFKRVFFSLTFTIFCEQPGKRREGGGERQSNFSLSFLPAHLSLSFIGVTDCPFLGISVSFSVSFSWKARERDGGGRVKISSQEKRREKRYKTSDTRVAG